MRTHGTHRLHKRSFLTQDVIVQLFFLKNKLGKLSPEIFFFHFECSGHFIPQSLIGTCIS